jgi:hypothetical protein
VLKRLLNSMDVECSVATNGQECVDIYQRDPSKYDIILMVRRRRERREEEGGGEERGGRRRE